MNATTTVIDLQGVGKTFDGPAGPIHALKDVQLTVQPGEFVGVRGPSGSGKSTLINMITGIDRPSRGDVVVNGQSLNDMSDVDTVIDSLTGSNSVQLKIERGGRVSDLNVVLEN